MEIINDRIEPYLCVYASQGAACIGDNKHKKICDAVETFWERAHLPSYKEALKRNMIMTTNEIIDRLEKNHPKIADIMKVAGSEEETSTDVAKKYNKLSSEFTKYANLNYISHEFYDVVDDAIRKTTYTTYGNAQESKVFEYVRGTLGIDVVEDPSFYKSQIGVIENEYGSFPWFIGGKIDGITQDRKTLIEIKNRVNRLFRVIPQYESIQIQMYLQLLGLEKAILVECLKTKERSVLHEDVNVISVNRDSYTWENDISPRLEGFVDFIIRIIHDTDLQDKYLKSKRRSAMVSSHINSYVKAKRS
jgi:hypothetical protein